MATITIDNLQSKRIISKDKSERLLDALLRETDWMHACGGKGKCTTCKVRILEGGENLSGKTDAEQKYFEMERLRSNERLTCQTRLEGDIRVYVPAEYQLPHLTYTK